MNDENQSSPPQDEFHDPLLSCLTILTQLHQRVFSSEALIAGLPLVDHRLTPELFIRAAERAGFIAKIVKRDLEKISNLVLPAVLILKNREACILKSRIDEETVNVIFPETGNIEASRSFNVLKESYTGFSILIHPITITTEPHKTIQPTEVKSWFWGTLWRFRRMYAEVTVVAFLTNIFALVTPLFIMNVYDKVVPNNALITLWALTVGVMIVFIFDLLLRILRGYLIDVSGKKADVLMASALFQHVMGLQLINKPRSVGAFINSFREFEVVRDFFTSATLTTFTDIPFLVLYLIIISYISDDLVYIPLIAIPIVLGTAFFLEIPLQKVISQALQVNAKKQGILAEALSGIEVIKSMVAEGELQHRWEKYVGLTANLGLRARLLASVATHTSYYVQQLVSIGVVIMGVYLIEANQLTLGGLIAVNMLASRSLAPLSQLASLLTRYQQAKAALNELNHLMALPIERPASKRFLHRPTFKGEIEFSHVSFQYPGQDIKALDDVSFKISPGERIALLGRVGSGKSTIEKLLLGFYRPDEGAVYLDGADLIQIDPVDLRRNIGYVPQDSLLFAGTVRDNIAMGRPLADDAAILEAARLSGADNFISRYPEGYGLMIGERGETLSGGQRQSITVARALLLKSSILLMDEPTSSMDDRTEMDLIANLRECTINKTLILVTHRPSLINLVNRLIIMDRGKLVLDGPRDQVIKMLTQPPKTT